MAAAKPGHASGVRRWGEMTSPALAHFADSDPVVLWPLGAVEQHGPHLPLATDAIIAEALVEAAAAEADGSPPLLILPPSMIGTSDEHAARPGTLSLATGSLAGLWTVIGDAVAAAGFRRLVLVNAHGGQTHVMDQLALDLRRRHQMLVVKASWPALGLPADLLSEEQRDHDIHGGLVETAMMMALRPDLVVEEECRDFRTPGLDMAARLKVLRLEGRVAIGWTAEDLGPDGVAGNAASASAALGRAILAHLANQLVAVIRDTARLDPLSLQVE